MNLHSAHRALADSALALLAAVAAIAFFLPPLVSSTVASLPGTVALGLTIAVAIPLHWALLGIAARRMGRSVVAWVGMAVLLFPVGGAAALILLAWFLHEPEGQPSVAR